MSSPYHFLNCFNKHILPIVAPLVSGTVLGYIITDADAHRKFQKYKPVVIPYARNYNFYVYAHSEEEYKKCVDELERQVRQSQT